MSPDTVMTQWLQDHSPSDITADDSCELFDPDESGNVIRCKHQDLNSDEISQHLRVGKRVSQLGIIWQDRLSMILQSDLSIKRLRLMDVLQQQREDTHAETALEQLDADFVLMTLEMEKFLPQLFEHCGGENKD